MASTMLKVALGAALGAPLCVSALSGLIGKPAPLAAPTKPSVSRNSISELPIDKKLRENQEVAEAKTKSRLPSVSPKDLTEADRTVRLMINLSGNLCAKPIEVARTSEPGLYGVECITNLDGSGRSNYLVDSRSSEVTKI